MAASNSVKGLTTVVKSIHFGGSSTKARRRATISFTDAVNGIAVGGTTHKLLATDLGFASFVDNCSNLVVFTTATKAPVLVVPAVPSPDLSYIVLADAANATAANHENPADVSISSIQTGQITIEGY